MKVWKFLGSRRRLGIDGNGRLVKVGKTLTADGEIVLCRRGIHAARDAMDALMYAPGAVAVRGNAAGTIVQGRNNLVCSEFMPLAIVDAAETLRHFSRLCALDVAHLWEPKQATVRFLKTGAPSLRIKAYKDAASVAYRRVPDDSAAWAARAARDASWDAGTATDRAAWLAANAAGFALAEIKGKQHRRMERMLRELIRKETT